MILMRVSAIPQYYSNRVILDLAVNEECAIVLCIDRSSQTITSHSVSALGYEASRIQV